LIKLHGSIDTYGYEKAIEKGIEVIGTGEFLYYKLDNYYDKQRPYRYDPETGAKVQSFHWNVDPNFIMGTKKEEIITQAGRYKTLYEESEKRLMTCKCLLIIGYSFSDDHINRLILKALKESKNLEKIIHVNPSKDFPYISIKHEIVDLEYLNELVNL